ncbi:hypothetical protein ONZ45_g600 [Pleurotus djamor]|nr:hypothetical protein ONZ45_g600 [Pleurotus djamor]
MHDDSPTDLTGSVVRQGLYPAAHGGFSDIWIGSWETGGETGGFQGPFTKKRLRRELCVWKPLQHANIVPLYGTVSGYGPYLSMVSPWMDNGNLNSYLQQHSTALTLAARFKLLCDISSGLQYLHQRNIIHGDLTGANVLISDDGRACLGDFGMSKIIAEFQGSSHMTTSIHTNLRWSAPEACGIDSDPSVTFFTDVYSFGSVMLQVLSGRIPYHYLKYEPQVLRCLVNHIRPQRPAENVTDIYWGFIQRCWVDNPRARPGVSEILAAITYFHHNLLDRPTLSPSSSWIGSENLGIPRSVVVPMAQNINANTNTLLQVAQGQDSASRSYHDAAVEPVWAVSPRVLLVDDDAVVQKLSTRLLRIFGCIIDSATDGAAAVDKMNNAIYDLVFMDIMMPKLDGVSATCLIRKFDTLTPIISMTSNSNNADVLIYYGSGMNDVLSKPFDKGRVLTILEMFVYLRISSIPYYPGGRYE